MRKFDFGVDTFIWSEDFGENDLWVIDKAAALGFTTIDFAVAHLETFPTLRVAQALDRTGLAPVTTTTLGAATNLVSPDPAVRAAAVEHMRRMVDVSRALGATVTGGVNYAGWGCLTGRPKTRAEWDWSVSCMREVADYALSTHPELKICVEPCNRFETHMLNTAAEAVTYCEVVGTPNVGVHLDCFHMSHEEQDWVTPVLTCGRRWLGYVHVNENQRGIPGTGMVDFHAFFGVLEDVGYKDHCVIESFDPNFKELAGNCAIWRRFAPTGEELAVKGLENLTRIADEVDARREPAPSLQLAE